MNPMVLAQFNVYWFIGLLLPVFLMFGAARLERRLAIALLMGASILGKYTFSVLACDRKWELRAAYVWEKYDLANQYLETPMPEEAQDAFADGANKIFTAFLLAPMEALIATFFWYAVARAWHKRRMARPPHAGEPYDFKDQY